MITLNGDSGITAPTYGGVVASEYHVPVTAFKNRILNGQMQIDQRNAGASVTVSSTSDVTYTADRWCAYGNVGSKFSVQQSTTAPAGFKNSLLVTSLAATTVGSTDQYWVNQRIEGLNVADFAWGTADAQAVTISFRVRSSLTGTFGGSLNNSANDRCYPFSYTISSANTWETKTITIAGDTSGTWLTTNGTGMQLRFGLGVGSTYSGTAGSWSSSLYLSATGATSVVGTSGATFYITGVQLEKGSTATSFDYRPYGTELALCQRYYEITNSGTNNTLFTYGTAVGFYSQFFGYAVQKRATPTATASFSSARFVVPGTSAVDGTGVHTLGSAQLSVSGFNMQVPGIATISASNAGSYTYEGTWQLYSSAEL